MIKSSKIIKILMRCAFLVVFFLLGMLMYVIFDSDEENPSRSEDPVTLEQKSEDSEAANFQKSGEKEMALAEPEPIEKIVSVELAVYTYEQMVTDLTKLGAAYAGLLNVKEVGLTADNRKIMEAVIGNSESPVHIVVQASIHGREYINTLLVMEQLEYILQNYDTGSYNGKSYKQLLEQVCFHILPMTNPDGVTISQQGMKGIQNESLRAVLTECHENDLVSGKTTEASDLYWERWKANARGVDLNRNFPSGWNGYVGAQAPSSDYYKGEFSWSEPEVQAIINVAKSHPTVCTISYHSSGNLVYWDYGSQGAVYEADKQLASLVSGLTGYSMNSTVQNTQDAAGCSDYFVLEKGIPSVTIENGLSDSPVLISEFAAIWNANKQILPALAERYAE